MKWKFHALSGVLIFVVLLCTTKKQEVKNGEHIKRKVPPKIERERKKNRKEHNKNNIDWRKIIMKHTAVRQRLIIFFFGPFFSVIWGFWFWWGFLALDGELTGNLWRGIWIISCRFWSSIEWKWWWIRSWFEFKKFGFARGKGEDGSLLGGIWGFCDGVDEIWCSWVPRLLVLVTSVACWLINMILWPCNGIILGNSTSFTWTVDNLNE
jgi:hypothetical protein